ncbi:Protein hu-li tai shao [Caenorhabditis elegans]|uniref:Protein hu-li tai shao n=1 Tax=Caenorhabditis elegans TaxID=6239 RepID=O17567_CAEEL|nr:Protein hu-li tai shao [Caenorhabditis elegans]CAB03830.2 Protein hu-li tai shao [Caenorhabditis elegans]|eukprot:NP_510288.1 Uncharacterized protein CELE_C04A11.1 [Caenorhabditis elegans]
MPETAADSSSDEHDWHDEKEDMLMMVMVVLLMLLSVVIWVAFCVAVRKTARKFIELKRQRRRQALLTAAINRAASTNEADRHNVLPIYITTLAHELNVFGAREEELPTYEEALSMSCTPSPNPVVTTSNRDRVPPYKPRSGKSGGRVLRIAPDRPGSIPTIVLPPSYESSVRHEAMLSPRIHSSPVPTSSNATAPSTSTSPPIYTISGNMHVTEC